MKSYLFSVFFLCISKLCISQVATADDDAMYLDSLFNLGTEKNYKYIRVVKDFKNSNKKSYEVIDYYKSGKTAMTGATTVGNGIIKTGNFVYFYENGNKKSVCNYNLNKQYGFYEEYYENGNKKLEGEWINNKENVLQDVKIKNCWNENGIQTIENGSGFFEEYYFKGALPVRNDVYDYGSGKIINNLKDSIWTGYSKKTKANFIENYKKGKLISGVSIDSNNMEHKYTVSEINAIPKNGMADFYAYVIRNFNFPKTQPVIRGKIFVTFVIDTDGKLVDIKVLRDLGYGTGKETIRVMSSYGNWIPGEHRGIKVKCFYSIPIMIESPK